MSSTYLLQAVPTPEKEFAEYTFKTEIYLDKCPTDAVNRIKQIATWMTALMNASGGLILLYSNIPGSDKKRDRWVMDFESHLVNKWISESILQELVMYQYLEKDGRLCIYIFVCRSRHLVTFNFHAHGRLATGIRPIKDIHRIQQMMHEPHTSASGKACESEIGKILAEDHAFTIGDVIPATYRESETMEFKHCYEVASEKTLEKKELPLFRIDKLKERLGEYLKYLSAFANTQGGSLVLGVEEGGKFPVVRGFPVIQNQEAEERQLTEYLQQKLDQCIWHGDPNYKPVMGQDWNVFYHMVIEEDGTERKMIEVRIAKHSGGMFLQSPVYYVVDKNGTMGEKGYFSDWKLCFNSTSFSDKTVTNIDMRIHTERPGTEINDGADRITPAQSVPEDQPQPGAAEATAETKFPKSFKKSQSEHKTDILVQGLSLHDCCTNRMAQHIKTLQLEGDKIWFPSIEHIRRQLSDDPHSDKLLMFLQQKYQTCLASIIDTEKETNTSLEPDAPGWMCYMLIIGEHEPLLLISCMSREQHCGISKPDFDCMVRNALIRGRILKRTFITSTANQQHQSCLFHFDIEVLLVPAVGDVEIVWDSRVNQPVTYPNTSQAMLHATACNGLAEELLRTRASVKDRYGQILTEHLTEAQARVLHAKRKSVLIVTGKSGTGKTVIALHLAKEATKEASGKQDVIYVCSNTGLKSFVNSQVSCPVIVMTRTNSMSPSQKVLLEKAKLLLVDDVHAIELDKQWESNPDDLYLMLFRHSTKPKTRVAIFFDPEQDYKKNLPMNFDRRLRNLAETVPGLLPQDIEIEALRERIRNSQEINRFMQANQTQANIPGTIECLNERPGDDVIYEYIGSNVEESSKIMDAKLDVLERKYGARSIAILCDDHEQMNEMKTLLIDQFNRCFQDENEYPIQHTLICRMENFGGLEAEVILFLLPRDFGMENAKVNWKYINVISSRARERLEFLLPWKPSSEQEQHEGLVSLLELFKTVSVVCR